MLIRWCYDCAVASAEPSCFICGAPMTVDMARRIRTDEPPMTRNTELGPTEDYRT